MVITGICFKISRYCFHLGFRIVLIFFFKIRIKIFAKHFMSISTTIALNVLTAHYPDKRLDSLEYRILLNTIKDFE